MLSLNFENVHYASYACIAFKDTKTVHNGLVGACRLHYTPNMRTINLSFEDRRCDWFTLQKNTQPGCPRSAISPSITQSELKMVLQEPHDVSRRFIMQFECFVQFLNDTGKRFNNLQRRKAKLKGLTLQFGKVKPQTTQIT